MPKLWKSCFRVQNYLQFYPTCPFFSFHFMLLSWQPAQHPICCNSLIIPCSFHATFHTCFYGRKMPAPCTVYCFVLSACILFYQAVTTIKRGHLILFLARTTSEHFPVVTGLGCCHFKGVFTPVRGLHTHTHTHSFPLRGKISPLHLWQVCCHPRKQTPEPHQSVRALRGLCRRSPGQHTFRGWFRHPIQVTREQVHPPS